MGYDLVIFDLDGTLVDSSHDLIAATNHVMRRLGFPEHPRDVVLRFIGDGARQLIERALPASERGRTDEALALFREHYFSIVTHTTRPFPGIDAALHALAPGRALAICTNKPARFTAAIVDGLGWRGRFREVLSGDDLPRMKPDALPISTLCERTGVAPDRAVLVGDGTQDVGAARAAGIAVCGVLWGFMPEAQMRQLAPDHLARTPADLAALHA